VELDFPLWIASEWQLNLVQNVAEVVCLAAVWQVAENDGPFGSDYGS
jgi:hypothetical protein